ncbi:hypothetical protein N8504_03025 [Akkermansiaceae bacterium]|nr:hypothetical protein [Akkermansiaceae bacterium]
MGIKSPKSNRGFLIFISLWRTKPKYPEEIILLFLRIIRMSNKRQLAEEYKTPILAAIYKSFGYLTTVAGFVMSLLPLFGERNVSFNQCILVVFAGISLLGIAQVITFIGEIAVNTRITALNSAISAANASGRVNNTEDPYNLATEKAHSLQKDLEAHEDSLQKKQAQEVKNRATKVFGNPLIPLGFLGGGWYGAVLKFSSHPLIDFLVCGILGVGFTAVALWFIVLIRDMFRN